MFKYAQEIGQRYLGRLRSMLGIKEHHKVIIYYGSIAYSRLPLFELLIETIKVLNEEHQDIKLLLVGKGDAVREVKDLFIRKVTMKMSWRSRSFLII